MKLRKSRPSIAASIGCMIVVSIPRRPAASTEKKTDAASAHSSVVIPAPPRACCLSHGYRIHRSADYGIRHLKIRQLH